MVRLEILPVLHFLSFSDSAPACFKLSSGERSLIKDILCVCMNLGSKSTSVDAYASEEPVRSHMTWYVIRGKQGINEKITSQQQCLPNTPEKGKSFLLTLVCQRGGIFPIVPESEMRVDKNRPRSISP